MGVYYVCMSYLKVKSQEKVKTENDPNIVMWHIVRKGPKNGVRLCSSKYKTPLTVGHQSKPKIKIKFYLSLLIVDDDTVSATLSVL